MENQNADIIAFRRHTDIPPEISHPASKHYPPGDDLVAELLNEMPEDDFVLEDETPYIHQLNYNGPRLNLKTANNEQLLLAIEAKLEHLRMLTKRNHYLVEEIHSRFE